MERKREVFEFMAFLEKMDAMDECQSKNPSNGTHCDSVTKIMHVISVCVLLLPFDECCLRSSIYVVRLYFRPNKEVKLEFKPTYFLAKFSFLIFTEGDIYFDEMCNLFVFKGILSHI